MTKKRILSMILGTAMTIGMLAGCGAAGSTSDTNGTAAESARESVQESTVTSDSAAEADGAVSETEDTAQETEASESGAAESEQSSEPTEGGKTLVVYYSAQGHTVNFANAIAEELNADLFELTPVEEYTEDDLNWRDGNSRVSREHDDESLRDIALVSTEVENWDSYDTVYIGYPIWWGIAAWPVDNFVKNNDFTGKTVIPFTTSSSSGIGESGKILEGYAGTGNWLEGKRFQSNADTADAKEWAASISK
ncbi:MAG: flavodoxin [Lachnospiraceae bacterium]|nr:flavodoxin [Lachnospiraceae bacterium]